MRHRRFTLLLLGLTCAIGGLSAQIPISLSGLNIQVVQRVHSGLPGIPPSTTSVSKEITVAPYRENKPILSDAQTINTKVTAPTFIALDPDSYWVGPQVIGTGEASPAIPGDGRLQPQTIVVTPNQVSSLTLYIDLYAPSAPPPPPSPEPDPDNGSDTALSRWLNRHFTASELDQTKAETSLWGLEADPDGDGLLNLQEYALDLDARTADSLFPAVAFQFLPNETQVSVRQHRTDQTIQYQLVASDNLTDWSKREIIDNQVGTDAIDRDYRWVHYRDRVESERFYRIEIQRVEP